MGHAAFTRNVVLTLFVAAHAGIHFLFMLKCFRIYQITHPFFFGVHAHPFFFGIFPLFFGGTDH